MGRIRHALPAGGPDWHRAGAAGSTTRPGAAGPRASWSGRDAGQRGAALLVAVTSIAILTALAVDLAYDTRVSLQSAANARDELRATYLARSGLAMSRLVLHFQQRMDAATASTTGIAGLLTGATQGTASRPGATVPPAAAQSAAAAAAGPLGAASMMGGVRLWDIVPVDSQIAALFLGGPDDGAPASGAPAAAPQPPASSGTSPPRPDDAAQPEAPAAGTPRLFGDMKGSFRATIEDEDRKINLRQFDAIGTLPAAQTLRFTQLIADPSWDFLFDEEDANGWRVSRRDLFGAIKDWVDEDETSSTYTANPAKPFEPGYGDENHLYDRLSDRYHAKNAPFDSQDELYMIAGFSDAFMAAFGDRLTVYPEVGGTINVNTGDPQQLLVNSLLMSDPPGVPQPALADPAFLQKLQAALALARPLPFMSITPQQFAAVLQALGVKVGAVYLQAVNTDGRNPFGNRSSTFRIRSVGVAGDVRKTIEAVVTFDRRAGGLAQDQGRLLHWRED